MKSERKIIIGLDGVPYDLISELTSSGVMPETEKIIESGTFKKMKSSIPEISSVSWSSLITGTNPGQHGIYGFTDIVPGTYTVNFPNFRALQSKPFWHRNPEAKYAIINVPFTYPAEELNGYLTSGFVAPDLDKAVYPEEILPELKELNYKVDVESNMAHKSMDRFLEELFEVLDARIEAYRLLWGELSWDTFVFVITGTDRLMHFLWEAHEKENHRYKSEFLDFFKRVDKAIGEINSRINKKDRLSIVSDHGFGPLHASANVNSYLRKHGFLELDSDEIEKRNFNAIRDKTKAFALDPGRIYLNTKSRFPKGSVEKEDSDKLLAELEAAFGDFKKGDKPVIKAMYRKEDLYEGPQLSKAPDLVLQPNEGFSLKGDITKSKIFEEDIFTGEHTYPDAIFIDNRPKNNKPDEDFSVEDIPEILGLINPKGGK